MLLLLTVVVVALAWTFQRRLIYLPFGAPTQAAEEVLAGGSAVPLHTVDGLELTAWHATRPDPPTGLTVRCYRATPIRLDRVRLARALAAAGFDVLLLEGYRATPATRARRPRTAWPPMPTRQPRRRTVGERGVRPAAAGAPGESLGAAVATPPGGRERPVAGRC